MNISNLFTLTEATGALGFLFSLVATLQKDDEKVKGWIALSGYAFTVHYGMLGATTGAVICGIAATRSVIAIFTTAPWLGYVFMALHTAVTLVIAQTLADWFGFVGGIVTTLAVFFQKGVPMRVSFLIVYAAWLGHNIAYGSFSGSLMSLVFLATTTYTLFNLRKKTP